MNVILYYSKTNESLNVANYIKEKTNYSLINIENIDTFECDNVFLVFPVYSQNIPVLVKQKIKKLVCQRAIIIATYGKMNYGRAVYDAQKLIKGKIIGGAYIPSKHSYKPEDTHFSDFEKLDSLIEKINSEDEVVIPKTKKNLFANMFKHLRAKYGVKIIKTDRCISCSICNTVCPNITDGKPNSKCSRCLKCVYECPSQALEFKLRPIHKKYLNKPKKNELIIYK